MTIQETTQVRALVTALRASEETVTRLQNENKHLRDVIAWLMAPWYGKQWLLWKRDWQRCKEQWRELTGKGKT